MRACACATSSDIRKPFNTSSRASDGPKFGRLSDKNDEGLIYAQSQTGLCQQLGGQFLEALFNFEVILLGVPSQDLQVSDGEYPNGDSSEHN